MSDSTSGPELLQDKFDVTVRDKRYTFRMPSIRYDMEVGYKAAEIRRSADPAGVGAWNTADYVADTFSRYCAIIELYLVAADEEWPFSPGKDGKPVVDSSRFPLKKRTTVYEIGGAFQQTFDRFCSDGDGPGDAAV